MVFKDTERSNRLRNQILEYFISSVMTDEERAELFGLPHGCRMRENAKIICPENLRCGQFVWIGEGVILDASGGLEIGEHTSIGFNTMVASHTSYLANLSLQNGIGSPLIERKPTRIGKGCFIAGPSVIYHGVSVGDKVVVAPMSVITGDVPSYTFVAGSPAKVKRQLSEDSIRREVDRMMALKQQAQG